MLHLTRITTRLGVFQPPCAQSSFTIVENATSAVKSILRRYSTLLGGFRVGTIQKTHCVPHAYDARRVGDVSSLKTAKKIKQSNRPLYGLPMRHFVACTQRTQSNSIARVGSRYYNTNWNFQNSYQTWRNPESLFRISWRKPIPLIIAANVGVYVMWATIGNTQSGHRWMSENWMVSATTWKTHPWTLLTSAFSHSGMLHLIFNMLAIGTIGRDLEIVLGRTRFVGLYMAAAVMGSFAHLLWSSARQPENWTPKSELMPVYVLPDGTSLLPRDIDAYVRVHGELPKTPLRYVWLSEDHVWAPALGASAAAAALFGLSATLWPQRSFLFLIFPIRASRLLLGFVSFSALSLLFSPDSHIGHAAHLSGLAVGISAALLTRGKIWKF